jgi:hypothetical protein
MPLTKGYIKSEAQNSKSRCSKQIRNSKFKYPKQNIGGHFGDLFWSLVFWSFEFVLVLRSGLLRRVASNFVLRISDFFILQP